MRVLVIGANGFIGRNLVSAINENHQVFVGLRQPSKSDEARINLLDKKTIIGALKKINPQVVVNCAGVVGNADDPSLNKIFTKNILDSVITAKVNPKIIICGSAAEYGLVDPRNLPVKEHEKLKANSGYGLSKRQEEELALKYSYEYKLNIVVPRIFNPIGQGMHPKFLISSIIRQVDEIKTGQRESIEVSRLDSKRDYIDIKDVALGIKELIDNNPTEATYNIGSGKTTTNQQLIDLILDNSKIASRPMIVETQAETESPIASQADISRMENEFGWRPQYDLAKTIRGFVSATGRS